MLILKVIQSLTEPKKVHVASIEASWLRLLEVQDNNAKAKVIQSKYQLED